MSPRYSMTCNQCDFITIELLHQLLLFWIIYLYLNNTINKAIGENKIQLYYIAEDFFLGYLHC